MERMKQLKTTSQQLMELFESRILVRHIAEQLESRSGDENASEVLGWMQERDFDVAGIEDQGSAYGYIEQCKLGKGLCKEYVQSFHVSDLVSESAALLDALSILRSKQQVFVLEVNKVTGIVTRGDLQKAPFRMLLFGLVTLLEMQLLRIIRAYYPDNAWKRHEPKLISDKRVKIACDLLARRKERNEVVDLADCLQFCDKGEIAVKTPSILDKLGFPSKADAEKFMRRVVDIRNKLAHGQDIVSGSVWPDIIDLVERIRNALERLEHA